MERARLRQSHERTVHSYSVWSQWTVSARPQQGTVKYDYCTVLAAVPRTGRSAVPALARADSNTKSGSATHGAGIPTSFRAP